MVKGRNMFRDDDSMCDINGYGLARYPVMGQVDQSLVSSWSKLPQNPASAVIEVPEMLACA